MQHRKDIYAEKLRLIPLSEEGGYFMETYRSPSTTTVNIPDREGKTRDVLTVIYYMISADLGGKNYWHKNKSEIRISSMTAGRQDTPPFLQKEW